MHQFIMLFDYNHIQTGSLIQANASPLSGRVTVFGRGAAERRWKKQLCSCTSTTKAEPDESLSAPHMWTRESGLTECAKTAVKSPWAWPNWKLIIFSLCFLSGGGSARGEAERFSVMRPGGNAVVNSHCRVELRPSGWRADARSVSGGLCASAWKCFECAELIECSVYRGCMCASWGSVVLPAQGLTQTHACSRSHTKAKKGWKSLNTGNKRVKN